MKRTDSEIPNRVSERILIYELDKETHESDAGHD